MPAAAPPVAIELKDYSAPAQVIRHVRLDVSLHATETRVHARMSVTPHRADALRLDGEGLDLQHVAINGVALAAGEYVVDATGLTIVEVPDEPFTLEITQLCNPASNTALSGLYLSNGMYCTQMEAQGFRRFAYFQDRPDVMATYDVRIDAPLSLPVLLANGNPGARGVIAGSDRHFAEWHDPHPKPSYLFALVAGDLAAVHDTFTTSEGRSVALGIYVERGKQDRCAWAMACLKASMTWDEQAFGRAYDLDVFNIVAVSDFNMGAMENKGLNIFNDKFVLALPATATDDDHVRIEGIIAHEYFHNWTGNRITCRDWFQLCLKEGLTVFRDQEFTSDMRSRAVKRIQDVRTLRARQFPEDQGPLAHAVRPSAYIEINNFYTPTIYEKGAEICRMMQTLIGHEAFRAAMDLYFIRHDGEAATVEDFVRCMADASGRDFTRFFRWYEQAGTPIVHVATAHDAATETYRVTIHQQTPPTPGQAEKLPLHLVFSVGLLARDGTELPLVLEGHGPLARPVIELTDAEHTFCFTGVAERPVLSINRGFTSPILLRSDETVDDLLFRVGFDGDLFNRWEAAQSLGRVLLLAAVGAVAQAGPLPDCTAFAGALRRALHDPKADNAFKAMLLQLPGEAEMTALLGRDVDSDHVHAARDAVVGAIAVELAGDLAEILQATRETGGYVPATADTARRALRSAALSLYAAAAPDKALDIVRAELSHPHSMTAEIAALHAALPLPDIHSLLAQFHDRHADDALVLDKWLMLSAQVPLPGAAARVEALSRHPNFTFKTPNRVMALYSGFSTNMVGFHAADGEGYRVLADAIIRLNDINPQVAARLATGFRSWTQFDAVRRNHALSQMERILAVPQLCRDAFEIITRTVGG